ncbi:hypothetical protein BDZ85DRAFT_198719 [Elsinoe ampelina]|uniref:Nucleoside phosphorylase domain-containing protein n=1 Tax=Elsinoe ampelina TaxID=302913 RepID=A0A6A6GB21_9PEZI|nr:hypothetical protein BDZ85DRAFT_198719 [Elsinoe ampelina]
MEPPAATRARIQVAILCALPREADAVIAVMDEIDADTARSHSAAPGNTTAYTTGRIGKHSVVLVHLRRMGKVSASQAAVDALHSFPSIRLALLVGICGGVPIGPAGENVYLGDLILSTFIEQYDFGRQLEGRFRKKTGDESTINRNPRPEIGSLLSKLQTAHHQGNMQSGLLSTLDRLSIHNSIYLRPASDAGSYFPSNYVHRHVLDAGSGCRAECAAGGVCDKAAKTSCEELGCDICEKITRPRRDHPTPSEAQHDLRIFFGGFGTADTVVKSGNHRDEVAKDGKLLAFEMEAAGLWEHFPTLIVKAVCDYADSHKNKDWQDYAAAVAAAGVKGLLKHWSRDASLDLPPFHDTPSKPKHWLMDQSPSVQFTGRTAELERIEALLQAYLDDPDPTSPCRIVIAGIGGVGKSEICLKIANTIGKKFQGVFWVNASAEDKALEGFKAAASMLGGGGDDIASCKRVLDNWREKWLLILDNADDTDQDMSQFLPTSSQGAVILTTRNPECFDHASDAESKIELDTLTDADAEELLLVTAGKMSRVVIQHTRLEAHTVCQLLGNHTLALVQAGSYIKSNFSSLGDYPSRFKRQKSYMLRWEQVQGKSGYGNVFATFETSYKQLSEHAKELLRLLSVLTWTPLPIEIFEVVWYWATRILEGFQSYDGDFRDLNVWHTNHIIKTAPQQGSDHNTFDRVPLMTAVNLLSSLALIKTSGDGADILLSMHPLIHEWVNLRADTVRRQDSILSTACFLAILAYSDIWDRRGRHLQQHLLALVVHLQNGNTSHQPQSKMAAIFFHLARRLYELRLVDAMAELLRHVPKKYAPDPTRVTNPNMFFLVLFAEAQELASNYKTAISISHLQVVYEACQAGACVRGYPRLAIKRYLATAYRKNAQTHKAIELLEDIHVDLETEGDADTPTRLGCDHELACAYLDQGRYGEAIEILGNVVEQQSKFMHKNNNDLLGSQHALARAYLADQQVSRAIELLELVVSTTEETLPQTHPHRLTCQHELASAYLADEQVTRAVDLLELVVRTNEKTLPETHPSRLISQHELARAYLADQQVSRAIDALEHVVKLEGRVLAEDHPERLLSQSALAGAYLDDGQVDRAIGILEPLVRISRVRLGEEHPDLLVRQDRLAQAYFRVGRASEGCSTPSACGSGRSRFTTSR